MEVGFTRLEISDTEPQLQKGHHLPGKNLKRRGLLRC